MTNQSNQYNQYNQENQMNQNYQQFQTTQTFQNNQTQVTQTNQRTTRKTNNGVLYWVSFTFVVATIFFSSWNIGITFGELLNSISFKSDTPSKIDIGNIDNVMESIDIVDDSVDSAKVKEILNIIGIYSNNQNDAYNQQSVLIDVNGRIDSIASSYSKRMLIFYYAYNNNLLSDISSSDYALCTNGCYGITLDVYNDIARKFGITDKPEQLFNSKYIYDYFYMFDKNDSSNTYKLKHNVSVEDQANDIIVTDNLRLTRVDNGNVDVRIITYTFKLNSNNEYYLYSVNVE